MPGCPGKHRITSSNAIRYRTEKYAAHANHRTCSRPASETDAEDTPRSDQKYRPDYCDSEPAAPHWSITCYHTWAPGTYTWLLISDDPREVRPCPYREITVFTRIFTHGSL
jgi:hypothetical protein